MRGCRGCCERSGIGLRAVTRKTARTRADRRCAETQPNPRFRKRLQGAQNRPLASALGFAGTASGRAREGDTRTRRQQAAPGAGRGAAAPVTQHRQFGRPGYPRFWGGRPPAHATFWRGNVHIHPDIAYERKRHSGDGRASSLDARPSGCVRIPRRTPVGPDPPLGPPLTAALFPARRSSFRTATAQGPRTSVRGPRIVTSYSEPRLTAPAYRRGCRACRRNGR